MQIFNTSRVINYWNNFPGNELDMDYLKDHGILQLFFNI